VTCPATPTTLAQGESITCTATYTVVQADVDAGKVVNAATGQAVFNEKPIDSIGTSVEVDGTQAPALSIVKTAAQDHFAAVGDKIDYTYVLTNTGNVTLSSPFTVTDDKVTVTCPATPTTLAHGDSITCTATYAVVQADVDAGKVVSNSTGHAVFNGESAINSAQTTVTVGLESVGGETATPGHSATPPVTSSESDVPMGGSTPIFGFLICLVCGALGLLAVTGQRRSVRRS